MGYFSNGTEGECYQAQYCFRCTHWPPDPNDGMCAVWLAHQLRNYEDCNNAESPLHVLIPRTKLGNGECRMFIPAPSMGLPFGKPE